MITLDLILCRVCGKPLYSRAQQEKLAGAVNPDSEPLCPQHRQRQAAARWPLWKPGVDRMKAGGA